MLCTLKSSLLLLVAFCINSRFAFHIRYFLYDHQKQTFQLRSRAAGQGGDMGYASPSATEPPSALDTSHIQKTNQYKSWCQNRRADHASQGPHLRLDVFSPIFQREFRGLTQLEKPVSVQTDAITCCLHSTHILKYRSELSCVMPSEVVILVRGATFSCQLASLLRLLWKHGEVPVKISVCYIVLHHFCIGLSAFSH